MALNVITAKFCSGANQTWTEEAWQYDYGQVLQFEGLDLPEAYQVHFSNTPMTGTTITQIGNADGVTVPDQFFTGGETIYAWVYLHEGEDDGETVYMVTIPVKKRPQPSDDVPTPVEQSAIDQAIAALNIAVEKAEDAIERYPQIIDGTWHVWDVTAEEYVDTGVEAQGEQGQPGTDGTDGQDGFSPVITVTDITGGHRVTITDAQGAQTFDVMDGSDASVTVDDALSTTSTNPVQNKVITEELNSTKADLRQKLDAPETAGTSGQVLATDGSGGTYWTNQSGGGSITIDTELSTLSTNPVQNKVITGAVNSIESKFNATDITYSSGDESGYYRVTNGAIQQATSSSFTCRIVEVTAQMLSVAFEIKSVSGISANIIYCGFADANHGYISKVDVAVGKYDLQIPNNAKYIYLSFFGSTYIDGYTIKTNRVVMSADLNKMGIGMPFNGLSAVAFGTSLTYRAQTTGGYLQYFPDMSGMTVDNQGVGSSMIRSNGGELDMLAKIKSYASYSNKTVCLFEGFINDWYAGNQLGTYTDTEETTVCGCVRSAINYMLSQNANLTIFLILDPYGRNYNSVDCSSSAVNGSGLTQYSFYEEVAKVGESLGIPVIKMYAESQISQNTPQYLLDNIHPNAAGAKQSANFIWSKIKQYYPNV